MRTLLLWMLAAAAAAMWACEPEVVRVADDDDGAGASSTGGAGGSGPATRPPGPPANGMPGDGPGSTYAVRKLYFGDRDWYGAHDSEAWKQLGYDIDGKISTSASLDLCKPNAGGNPAVHDDGDGGIDNSYGSNIWPIVSGLAPTASDDSNQQIADGNYTYLFHIEALGDAPSYLDLSTRFYAGAALGSPPSFDGSDTWPVTAESLLDPGDVTSSRWRFPQSYVNEHVLVSGTMAGSLGLGLDWQGQPMSLVIHHAVFSMVLSPDRSSADRGIISGIIDTEEYIEELRKIAGNFSPSLCEGTTFDSIANQLRQASDILIDGTQDPTKTCNGISIGLGFEAVRVQLGGIAPPQQPPADPCAMP